MDACDVNLVECALDGFLPLSQISSLFAQPSHKHIEPLLLKGHSANQISRIFFVFRSPLFFSFVFFFALNPIRLSFMSL
jgi:hypothetical protein